MTSERRVALVTGGSRGIGRACAMALGKDGCDVAVVYRRDEDAAADAVAELEKHGAVARSYRASIDVRADVEAMVPAVVADYGRLDVVVHAAGIASRGASVVDTDPAELQRLLDTHAVGAHHLCRLAVPALRRQQRGDVVFISSIAVRVPVTNGAPYNMAKAALESLAMTLAKEERPNGIHVNVVAPGLVATDMGRRLVRGAMGVEDISTLDAGAPFGRVCRPEDVAGVVRFLCSAEAGYVTGQVITVDGGG